MCVLSGLMNKNIIPRVGQIEEEEKNLKLKSSLLLKCSSFVFSDAEHHAFHRNFLNIVVGCETPLELFPGLPVLDNG